MKLLLLSDDVEYSRRWYGNLQTHHVCDRVTTLQGLLAHLSLSETQIVILMVKKGTEDILLALRQKYPTLPFGVVVFAPSFNRDFEQRCYEHGADYFFLMETPFPLVETRLLNLERRVQRPKSLKEIILPQSRAGGKGFEYEGFTISPDEKVIRYNGEILNVSPIHHKLLVAFITRTDQLLTRPLLLTLVWSGRNISSRSIDAQISKLKKQFPVLRTNLVNLYGRGYILRKPNKNSALPDVA